MGEIQVIITIHMTYNKNLRASLLKSLTLNALCLGYGLITRMIRKITCNLLFLCLTGNQMLWMMYILFGK